MLCCFWQIHGMTHHPAELLMMAGHDYATRKLPDLTLLWTNSKDAH